MAISKIDNGDGTTTVSFTYTANTQKVTDTLTDAAYFLFKQNSLPPGLFPEGKPDWASVTQSQRGLILDYFVRTRLLDLAKQLYIQAQVQTAKEQAENETGTRYI